MALIRELHPDLPFRALLTVHGGRLGAALLTAVMPTVRNIDHRHSRRGDLHHKRLSRPVTLQAG